VLIGAGAASLLLASHALAAGPLAASQPGFTILDPLTAGLLGLFLFGEHIQTAPVNLAAEALALALLVGGAATLSHSHLLAADDTRTPATNPADTRPVDARAPATNPADTRAPVTSRDDTRAPATDRDDKRPVDASIDPNRKPPPPPSTPRAPNRDLSPTPSTPFDADLHLSPTPPTRIGAVAGVADRIHHRSPTPSTGSGVHRRPARPTAP
jgi:hypothetical protein